MTTTSSTSNVTGAVSGLATGNNKALSNVNFDTFLKLLVSQLKNQDPLNPMDGTQFTSQIAQFSSLEQQVNGNNYLKELVAQRDFGQQALGASYLGKAVLGPGNAMQYGGGATQFGYTVAAGARNIDVEVINDATGETVRTFQGEIGEGKHLVTWDGKNDSGTAVSSGNYTVRITAQDVDGKKIAASPMVYGQVASVLTDGGSTSLQLADGRTISIEDVVAVTGVN